MELPENHSNGTVHHDDDFVGSFSFSSFSSNGSSMELNSSDEEEVSSNFVPSSAHDSLSDMSSLLQQLPIKMGLSRHYDGKSRSFTSLASVKELKDLVKEDNAQEKKMKKCWRRNYGGEGLWRTNALSRNIGKRRRPPIPHPTHRSTTTSTISNQTPLFA